MTVRLISVIISTMLLAAFPLQLFPEDGAVKKTPLPLDKKFYTEFSRTPLILRDDFMESRLNSIVLARGLVTAIQKNTRLKKKYRIILTDPEAERLNIKIRYHVYIDSKISISMLKENKSLEFSGQLIAYTPVSSKRDAYILDIIFEKGAILVE